MNDRCDATDDSNSRRIDAIRPRVGGWNDLTSTCRDPGGVGRPGPGSLRAAVLRRDGSMIAG
jgi:hypothetical protein